MTEGNIITTYCACDKNIVPLIGLHKRERKKEHVEIDRNGEKETNRAMDQTPIDEGDEQRYIGEAAVLCCEKIETDYDEEACEDCEYCRETLYKLKNAVKLKAFMYRKM